MADTKISALPASTTPLAGTEVLPIVQSGVTKQVSVANLTAGRAVSASSVTASTGNFVVGTSGQGIDFSATPGTGTSELFDDYEIGTWTPTVTFAAGSATLNSSIANYTKIGRLVNVTVRVTITTTGVGTSNLTIGGLPFTSLTSNPRFFAAMTQTNYSSSLINDGVKAIVSGGTTLVWTDRAVALIDATFFLDFAGSYVV